jgi:hypothetical protein
MMNRKDVNKKRGHTSKGHYIEDINSAMCNVILIVGQNTTLSKVSLFIK